MVYTVQVVLLTETLLEMKRAQGGFDMTTPEPLELVVADGEHEIDIRAAKLDNTSVG